MRKITKESDFKEVMMLPQRPADATVVEFKFEFQTADDSSYIASWDGTDTGYTNSLKDSNGHIVVLFKNHGLKAGKLQCHRHIWFADAQMPDGKLKYVDDIMMPIEIVEVDDSIKAMEAPAVIHAIERRPRPCAENFAPVTVAKPVKGVDYFTDAEVKEIKTEVNNYVVDNVNDSLEDLQLNINAVHTNLEAEIAALTARVAALEA